MSEARAWRDDAWSPVAPAPESELDAARQAEAAADRRAGEKGEEGEETHANPARAGATSSGDEARKGAAGAEGQGKPPVPPRPARSFRNGASRSLSTPSSSPTGPKATFAAREEINATIELLCGNAQSFVDLHVDALVNRTNERLNDWSGLSSEILARAGPMLEEECSHVPSKCHIGEAKITAGCQLHAAYVIHTVGPKFSTQYETAAQSALHMCYRNVLTICKERRLRSVAMPLLYSRERGYPREDGAQTAVRTIRRFLDHFVDDFDRVVLYLGNDAEDTAHIRRALALYCPRSRAEEVWSMSVLPENTGNEWGEIVLEDRRVRISSSFPSVTSTVDGNYMPVGRPGPPPPPPARAFTEVVYGVDTLVDNLAYTRLLERADDEDFKDMVALNIIYRGGNDMMGRPIVVIAAANLTHEVREERLLLYFVHVCDKLSRHPKGFVVVFFDHPGASEHLPGLSWFKHQYEEVIGRKYKKNLRRMYVVHATWQLKALFWGAMPFVSSKFWDKFYYLDSLEELYRYIPAECILLPSVVFRHDKRLEVQAAQSWF
ncbi:Ganglioside-induced differentiation-associated protein 2 [Hondaea fermentalgiana]|uniref:Ganglioside-induced differentiation-associated protein 2 n=1 Tax=Hondaea fermentalgiana TaxID=2315210 RepID=A0A2R5GHW9_9STRA|nr:Ganglioside-induced differentiation-associated protein 2 [Hondaea fermentalgiana]|eukprot:GBG29318.1 Ganglioside-induced differentiation-associated protein 2 [Hondaea fermentalgiana]